MKFRTATQNTFPASSINKFLNSLLDLVNDNVFQSVFLLCRNFQHRDTDGSPSPVFAPLPTWPGSGTPQFADRKVPNVLLRVTSADCPLELLLVCSTISTAVVGYDEVPGKWRSVLLSALNLRKFKGFSPLLCTWAVLSKEKGQQTYMWYTQIKARDGRRVKEVTSMAAGQRNTLSDCREAHEVSFCNRQSADRECL